MQANPTHEITAADICDALGRKEIAARLERTVAAVSNAASDGVFPSGWFIVISEMCADRGIECPAALFKFIQPASQQKHSQTPAATVEPTSPTPDEDAA